MSEIGPMEPLQGPATATGPGNSGDQNGLVEYSFASKKAAHLSERSNRWKLKACIPSTDHYENQPNSIKIIANTKRSNQTGSIRLWDMTNNQLIVEINNISGKDFNIYDMGTLQWWPSDDAIIGVQMKTNNTNNDDDDDDDDDDSNHEVRLASLWMEF